NGVEVRSPDVAVSAWDCTLEPPTAEKPAVRLGLRLVKGLSADGASALLAARGEAAFVSVPEMAHRVALNMKDMRALAPGGALNSLSEHRRRAYWDVAGVDRRPGMLGAAPPIEENAILLPPTEAQDIVADYNGIGLTLRRHPMALLRDRLTKLRFVQAEKLATLPAGRRTRACG